MLQPALRNDLKQINAFQAEAMIMATIEHERIVPFIGVAWDSLRDLCVVTKFMASGDLHTLLRQYDEQKSRQQGLDEDKIRITMHVAHALAYLQSLKPVVIHRDLKSRNFLLDAELTDFGVSREATDQTMTVSVGKMLWMAPEIMVGERYDERVDIFSFGLVLTELASHQIPYAGTKSASSGHVLTDTAILQMVAMRRLQAQFSQRVPQWLRDVGTSFLTLEPTDRPSSRAAFYRHIANKELPCLVDPCRILAV